MPELDKPISLSYGGNPVTPPSLSEGIRVTLPDVAELKSLPKSGEITFRFTRDTLRLGKDDGLSADIYLCEICAIEPDEAVEEKDDDVVDKLFAEADKKAPDDYKE